MFDIGLFEWDGPDGGGPRLLGRLQDRDLVEAVRERLLASRRAELERLERGTRPAPPPNLRPLRGGDDG